MGRCRTEGHNDIHREAGQFARDRGEPIGFLLRRTIVNSDGLTFNVAELAQPVPKVVPHGSIIDDADPRQPIALLRPRRERPRRRAAEQRDELATPHSITSSARASSAGRTSRPIALALLRLMINSNLVGCSTGRSAGFAPRVILST